MDTSFFNFIYGASEKWWLLDWLGIFFAEYAKYLIILAAIFIFFKQADWRRRIYFFALASLSVILARGIITEIIRFFYYRPRPFVALEIRSLIEHSVTASFPSGHGAIYFALALAILYFNKKWGWRCLILALLIGLARIFVGVHWPLDIVAGSIVGLGSAFLIKKILPKTD